MAGTIHEPTIIIEEEELALHETSRIDSFCLINAQGGLVIDSESVIHAGSRVVGDGYMQMDPRSVITYNCVILTSTADLSYSASSTVPKRHRKKITGDVVLERETFVGSGSVIMPGVTVHEGACVAANTYLSEDVPPWTIRFPDGSERKRERADDARFRV